MELFLKPMHLSVLLTKLVQDMLDIGAGVLYRKLLTSLEIQIQKLLAF
jgi:hypothetical protein